MRWIKKLLVSTIVLFAVFIIVVGILLITLDDEDYRKLLITLVNTTSDITLSIDGRFSFELSTEPFLSASQVNLQSPGGLYDIQIDDIEAQIKLSPLIVIFNCISFKLHEY